MVLPLWLLRLSTWAHVILYRMSGGRLGKTLNGMPVLLLTTHGRRSGRARTVPLVYLRSGPHYVIGAGIRERPAWYLNLRTEPQASIQIGTRRLDVVARQVHGEERRQLWARTPAYWDDYQNRAKGELPLMVLTVES